MTRRLIVASGLWATPIPSGCIPLEFVRELPEIVLTQAPTEPVSLECELSRRPREPVKWLKDGKPLPMRLPTHIAIEEDKGSTVHRINFAKLTDEDLGQYTIQVENIASTGGVQMRRIPLEFVRELPEIVLTQAPTEPASLECELSRRPREPVKWLKDGKPLPMRLPTHIAIEEDKGSTVHRINFAKLTDEDLGQYTIQVENIASTGGVQMRLAPVLRLSEKFEDTIILKAGASTVVEVPFMASPKPTVEWTWKSPVEGSQPTTPRFKPDVAPGLTSLPLGKVKREDAGDYTVVIANELGESTVTVHLIVLDKPSPPRNPQVTDNTGERVIFKWQEPEFPGGEPGSTLEYVVEMREASMRAGKPVTKTTQLSTPIEGLQLNKSYVFMVAAKNSVGQSDFVEAKPVSTKLDFGPPPTPINVQATVNPKSAKPTDQTIELTWELPADKPLPKDVMNEYTVEMKPKDSTRWQEVPLPTKVTETHCTLRTDGMKEFVDYEFRVTAMNKAGKSKPSEPSNSVQLGIPLEFVRELPEIVLTQAPTEPVSLECELSRRPREPVKWLKDGKPLPMRLPTHIAIEEDKGSTVHRINFAKLTDEDLGQYTIQVENIASTGGVQMRPKNSVGQSDFVEAKPVSTKLDFGPPPTPINVEATVNPKSAKPTDQTIELTWELPADKPLPKDVMNEYTVEMKPKDSTRWQEVPLPTKVTETHCTLRTDGMKEFVDYEFRVTAMNKAGKSKPSEPSNSVQLGIPLEFVRELPEIVLTQAPTEPVSLECELSRRPREPVKWLKDGKPLPMRLPTHIAIEEDKGCTVHRINFAKLTDEDLGQYTIQVENIASTGGVQMRRKSFSFNACFISLSLSAQVLLKSRLPTPPPPSPT
nr:unnamed protein product [Spirometra erinaceieuropaei]